MYLPLKPQPVMYTPPHHPTIISQSHQSFDQYSWIYVIWIIATFIIMWPWSLISQAYNQESGIYCDLTVFCCSPVSWSPAAWLRRSLWGRPPAGLHTSAGNAWTERSHCAGTRRENDLYAYSVERKTNRIELLLLYQLVQCDRADWLVSGVVTSMYR